MTGYPVVMRAPGHCSDRFRIADHSSIISSFAFLNAVRDPFVQSADLVDGCILAG